MKNVMICISHGGSSCACRKAAQIVEYQTQAIFLRTFAFPKKGKDYFIHIEHVIPCIFLNMPFLFCQSMPIFLSSLDVILISARGV